jgi:iron(III) transport system permease protein
MTRFTASRELRPAAVRRRVAGWVTPLIVLAVLVVAIGLPAVSLLRAAFSSGLPTTPGSHFTFDNLATVYASTTYLLPLGRTLLLAAVVACLSTLIGTGLAFLHVWGNPYGKRVLRAGFIAPMFISPVIGVIAWTTLAQPGAGLLNRALSPLGVPELDIISVGGTAFVMMINFTPIVFTFVSEALERIGADVYEAATVTGARRLLVFDRVTLRLVAPASVSVFFLVVILASEMYTVPSLLAAQDRYYVLSQVVFSKMTGYPLDYPGAASLSTLLLLIVIVALAINQVMNRRRERFTTVTGKGAKRIGGAMRPPARMATTVIAVLYIIVTVVLPIAAIIIRSFLPFFAAGDNWAKFDVSNYTAVFVSGQLGTPLENSLMFAALAVVVAMILAGTIAYLTVRRRGWLFNVINALAFVPLGFPGTVFAVGLVWTFIGTPVYKSSLIVVIAIFVGWLPIVLRILQTSVLQSSPELEEAAETAGASPLRKFVNVVFPLLRTSLFLGAALAVVFTVNEVSGAAIVGTGSSETLAVRAFHYIQDGQSGYAAVVALVQIAIMAVFAVVLLSLAGRNQARNGRQTRIALTAAVPLAATDTKSLAVAGARGSRDGATKEGSRT